MEIPLCYHSVLAGLSVSHRESALARWLEKEKEGGGGDNNWHLNEIYIILLYMCRPLTLITMDRLNNSFIKATPGVKVG